MPMFRKFKKLMIQYQILTINREKRKEEVVKIEALPQQWLKIEI